MPGLLSLCRLREVVREPDSLVLCLVFDFLDFDFHRLMEMVPALGQNTTLVKVRAAGQG